MVCLPRLINTVYYNFKEKIILNHNNTIFLSNTSYINQDENLPAVRKERYKEEELTETFFFFL